MKKVLFTFLSLILCTAFVNAQGDIVRDLNSSKYGQGNVKIFQDEAIQNIVAVRSDSVLRNNDADLTTNFVKVKGFKIQVFSGNNQSKSKNEAFSKKAQVENAFPEMETVVTFNSPFWRLRVGNFQTREEAEEVLKEMKRKFPSFREMYIVSDTIKRPAY